MNLSDEQALDGLRRDVERLAGSTCADCPRRLCGHDAVFSVALGFKDRPRCLACLARGLGRAAVELRDELRLYVRSRDCYRTAWEEASAREGVDAERPACVWETPPVSGTPRTAATVPTVAAEPAAVWDAGAMACGDLVLALRGRLLALTPGAVLRVIARDPAAPADLPAWCRLTGHRLVAERHPEYLIQRKGG